MKQTIQILQHRERERAVYNIKSINGLGTENNIFLHLKDYKVKYFVCIIFKAFVIVVVDFWLLSSSFLMLLRTS